MTYRVEISDAAQGEAEAAFFWMLRRSPAGAAKWYAGLLAAIASLDTLPRRCPLARENAQFDREIRQLLYGRGRSAYRVLFMVVEPNGPGEDAVVRVLHIRHGAQRDLGSG